MKNVRCSDCAHGVLGERCPKRFHIHCSRQKRTCELFEQKEVPPAPEPEPEPQSAHEPEPAEPEPPAMTLKEAWQYVDNTKRFHGDKRLAISFKKDTPVEVKIAAARALLTADPGR